MIAPLAPRWFCPTILDEGTVAIEGDRIVDIAKAAGPADASWPDTSSSLVSSTGTCTASSV
jgi:hypothetical protein